MDEMSSKSVDVQAVPRPTQTGGSQTYQRYSPTSGQGESTEKLGPIQPIRAQYDGPSVNMETTTSMAARDELSDAANGDSGDQVTQSSPRLKGGRVRNSPLVIIILYILTGYVPNVIVVLGRRGYTD